MIEGRRCLVIDDHPMVRLGVRQLLGNRYEVEESGSGKEALQLLTDVGQFDVAIVGMRQALDAGSQGLSGPGTIRALLVAQPGLGIVAHGDRPERDLASEVLAAGANAYVAKSSPAERLTRAVEAAVEAERYVDPAVSSGGRRRGRTGLTRRQRQTLQLIADGNSTLQIARRLGLSTETVKTHTKQLLARLKARDRAHAVAIGLRNALID